MKWRVQTTRVSLHQGCLLKLNSSHIHTGIKATGLHVIFFPSWYLIFIQKTPTRWLVYSQCYSFLIFILMFPHEGRKWLIHLTARDQSLKDAVEFIHRNEGTSGKQPGFTQTFCVISARSHHCSMSQIFISK